ncbi:hypothetical protein [Nocardia puris]|uniref:Uncharacterized protein n=1 Tax=Nocardia puris TaxID=208602 RepID=A0A366DN17_9NOCA|nr:hypothetical protein [Nocardia puris]RBO91315.1 hypothetical protein DFR74_10417 [Nocardia puris]
MTEPYREHTIDRDGSTYRLAWFQDEDSDSPREWDCSARLLVYEARGFRPLLDEIGTDTPEARALKHVLQQYGHTDEDKVTRAFSLWRAITGASVQLVTGAIHCWREEFAFFALANDDKTAHAEAREYEQWIAGEVARYELHGPGGELIAAVGGWYSEDDAEYCWRAELEEFHAERLRQTRCVGAGLIGVI